MSIGGSLDMDALMRLTNPDEARMRHFLTLNREAQIGTIRRLAAAGHSSATIAAATRLSEEQIRSLLKEPACSR